MQETNGILVDLVENSLLHLHHCRVRIFLHKRNTPCTKIVENHLLCLQVCRSTIGFMNRKEIPALGAECVKAFNHFLVKRQERIVIQK